MYFAKNLFTEKVKTHTRTIAHSQNASFAGSKEGVFFPYTNMAFNEGKEFLPLAYGECVKGITQHQHWQCW